MRFLSKKQRKKNEEEVKKVEEREKKVDEEIKQPPAPDALAEARKVMSLYLSVFNTLTELVKNNFNIWIYHEGGKVCAKVSTYQNKDGVKEVIRMPNFMSLIVEIAKKQEEYMSGGSDMFEMMEFGEGISEGEKKIIKSAMIEGAKEWNGKP